MLLAIFLLLTFLLFVLGVWEREWKTIGYLIISIWLVYSILIW